MTLFKRRLQQRAAKIDQQRWASVVELLEAGELPIENTPAKYHFVEGTEHGFFYLTDRAVIMYLTESDSVKRLRLDEIEVIQLTGEFSFFIGWRVGGEPGRTDIELYPSPLSEQMYSEMKERVALANGSN